MRILITRPAAAARALARELEARGHQTSIEPLLSIEPIDRVAPDLAGVQAIILTSAHAVPALDRRAHALPVFTVGEATAAAARAAGCARVVAGAGDATRLAALISGRLRPETGLLLHLAGADVRPGLDQPLREAGFQLRRQVVYRARPARHLSARTEALLRDRAVDAVLLFSPRTAATFARLIEDHQLGASLGKTEAICLSAAVAEACCGLRWGAVRVAPRPAEEAVVQLLDARG